MLTARAIATVVPGATGIGPEFDNGTEQCEWSGGNVILHMFAQPRRTPWAVLVNRDAQEDRDLMSAVHGSFAMGPVPALGQQAESFYSRSVSADDASIGSSQTDLTWFVAGTQLDLGLIGGPSIPDETTALVALARTLTTAAESPTFVP